MVYKNPLNINVVLNLIEEVFDNTIKYLEIAQKADKEYSFEVVELERVKEILSSYREQKLVYGTEINEKVYYNNEEVVKIKVDKYFNAYDLISLALAVLLTQNRVVIYLPKINSSYSLDLIINLLKKFAQNLKLYEDYLHFEKINKKVQCDLELHKKDDKIMYARKNLEIEFDFNLLLKAYEIKS